MNKKIFFIATLTFISIASTAYVTSRFSSWDGLIAKSSDIIVIQCLVPRFSNSLPEQLIESEVSVVDVLKGPTDRNSHRLGSRAWLQPNEYYLVFANYEHGYYSAAADYQFVQIGGRYVKEMAVGNTVDEKVRSLLQRRLDFLNRQIPREQEEKQRLEKAFR